MSELPDTAKVVGPSGPSIAMVTDGECLRTTLRNLEDGVGSGKPLSSTSLAKSREQAVSLLEQVLTAYEHSVAHGEVGAGGSGRASNAPALAGKCPTGLLYGRIQSGKTLAMITFAAVAMDNGFRVVVVLTSDNIKLVDQTASRFQALDAIVMNSTLASSWPQDATHVQQNLSNVGLVLICQKNQSHLATLVEFLRSIEAAGYPALIMDDEADQATLDTTVNARSSGRANAPKVGSTIHRRTVKNDRPDEAGDSVAEVLGHHVFLQVTATPYALLLQNAESALRPSFTKLLEPGDGYTGGEAFFSGKHLDDNLPPLILVDEEESDELEHGLDSAPAGLVAALAFFLVSAAAQAVADPAARVRAQNFLCHTSQKQMEHEKVSVLIRAYLAIVGDALREPTLGGEVAIQLEKAYRELKKTVPHPPPLEDLVADLRKRLPRRQVVVVNSSGANAEFATGTNFIVGGNILGRGLTIENLLVSYYLRRAKVSQMDTMLQHARMFGYRGPLMPYTRVFLPGRLAIRFHRIHTAEQHLRELLSDPERAPLVHVEVSTIDGLRATRNNVLDMSSVIAYTPGQHIYPTGPLTTKDAHKQHDRAKKEVQALGATYAGDQDAFEVSIADLIKLIAILPFDPTDEDTWDPRALQGLLRSNEDRFGGRGFLFCRKMKRTGFREGALGGPELKLLRSYGKPVLCVFLDTDHKLKGYEEDYVYPTLVLPESKGMPAHVFNVSE